MTDTSQAGQPSRTFDFSSSRIIIAGGTSGVGLTTAAAFLREGCQRLVILGRDHERGSAAVERLVAGGASSSAVTFVQADLCEPGHAQRAADQAVSELGGAPDVLVNSVVAPYQPALLHQTPIEQLKDVLIQQALGPLLMTRAVLPSMRDNGHGSIITLASDAAKVPTPGETGIGAAMAAIVMFSQTLAVEAKRSGIRVNVLTPSLIAETPGYNRAMAEEFSKKIFEKIVKQAHLGLTTPTDLANAILFLASPLSERMTGQVISINGGISVA